MVTKKLYCYVDETGQDTKGALFVVSVIIAQKDRDKIVELLKKIEKETGKKRTKWQSTKKEIKKKYIEAIFAEVTFKEKIFYSLFKDAMSFRELTVITIASAINTATTTSEPYKASIFIDGLQKPEVARVSANLRKLGIRTEKVRGVRDESNAIIRLADAIVGFVREYIEDKAYAKKLYRLGIKNKILQKA